MDFELEQLFEIWDNRHGQCTQVGPDRDGLGLIEIRYKNEEGKISATLTFTKEQARLVAEALNKAAGE